MKFIIVGHHGSGKNEVCAQLEKNGIEIGRLFSNGVVLDKHLYQYCDKFTTKDVLDIFENNAYVFMKEMETMYDECYVGLTRYEFDRAEVFALSPAQFLCIPQRALCDNLCIIWLDSNTSTRRQRYLDEKREYNFYEQDNIENICEDDFIESLYNFPKSHLLYFCNEDPGRVASIVYAIAKHNELLDIFETNYK